MLLAALGIGLAAACGGSTDVARPTGPVKKVAWNDSEAEAPAEEAPPAEEKPSSSAKKKKEKKAEVAAEPAESEDLAAGNAIDVDAMPARAAPKPAPRAEPVETAGAEEEPQAPPEDEPAAKAEPEPESPAKDPLAAELRKRRAQARARSEAQEDKEEKAPKKKKAKAAAEAEEPVASYKGSDPCRAPTFSVSRVREACASGGRAAAKRVMKDAIGKATATGQLLKCSDCHSNQRDYSLKANAVAQLKHWLDSSSS